MTHLSMEQLLATRDPGLEPQVQAWREHLDQCGACRAERDRLEQRVARLKALPHLRPSRDLFGPIRFETARTRRRQRVGRLAVGGLALAASVAMAVVAGRGKAPKGTLVATDSQLALIMSQSKQLEQAVARFDQDRMVVDGRTVAATSSLEDRLARIDREIEAVGLADPSVRQQEMLRLWRERVGLLDALVDIHLTGARYVGF